MISDRDSLPPTSERVAAHSDPELNRRIRRRTESTIAYYAGHPEEIDARLGDLDREWDIERVLEANASTLSLFGVTLGVAADRRFLTLPAVVAGFLLQHALQGWCPPIPVFRRLGFRTAAEIARERYALKYIRGDFAEPVPAGSSDAERARQALAAVRA